MHTKSTRLFKQAYCDVLESNLWSGASISSICQMFSASYTQFSERKLDSTSNMLMPKNIHHIWFTNENSPREPNTDTIIKTNALLLNDQVDWTHALWTNNKALIPKTVSKLEDINIKVFEIGDLISSAACDLIQYNIEKKYWGIASDIARLVILEQFGGIYTDVNYILDHLPWQEMSNYKFFAQSRDGVHIGNYFIASTPHNKILTTWLGYIEDNLSDAPPPYITEVRKTNDIREITITTTALPSCLAFFCKSEESVIFINSECDGSQECLGSDPTGNGAETWLS